MRGRFTANFMAVLLVLAIVAISMPYSSPGIAQDEVPQANDDDIAKKVTISILGLDRLRMPKADEIEEMIIEVYGYTFQLGIVKPFTVPTKYYDKILERFGEPELQTQHVTIGFEECGCLRIKMKKGREIYHVPWYWTGKSQLFYSLHGVQCSRKIDEEDDTIGAESLILHGKIKEILDDIAQEKLDK